MHTVRDIASVEMAQLRLIRSAFEVKNGQPEDDRVFINVSLENDGEFLEGGRRAHFVQNFSTGHRPSGPFVLEVRFAALFLLNPPPLPLERAYYVRKVFPQLVFPYLREYVAEVTRRGGFSPLLLNPSILNFEEPDISGRAAPTSGPQTVH